MKILFISPLGKPYSPNKTRYSGIERLVWEFARTLCQEHEVGVMAHTFSQFPTRVSHYKTTPPFKDGYLLDELRQYQTHCRIIRDYDVIHDFSHQHIIARLNPNMPTLNVFWHAPCLAQYQKAPYNIVSLSNWAASEYKRFYHQKAIYQETIAIDEGKYKPFEVERNDRFLAIGRMGAEKGHHNAISLCKQLGVGLDIIGARGTEQDNQPMTDYEKKVMDECDGTQIRFLGDIGEPEKIKYLQSNMALLYATSHPEVTSHKLQEALFCGMPVIAPRLGGVPEIIEEGVDGFLCNTGEQYLLAMQKVKGLQPNIERLRKKYSVKNVVEGYIPLYEKVKDGARWA